MREVLRKEKNKIYVDSKKAVLVGGILILLMTLAPIYSSISETEADKMQREVCRNFRTRGEAQARYDKYINDPELSKYVKQLDGANDDDNNDGISQGPRELACEHLPVTDLYGAKFQ